MEHLEFPQTQTTESVLSIARIPQITYPAGDPGVYNRDVKRKRRYPRVVRKSRNVGKLRACAHSVYHSLDLYGRPGNEASSMIVEGLPVIENFSIARSIVDDLCSTEQPYFP